MHTYPSELAQTFYTATAAFTTCLAVTFIVSLATKPRPESELHGLVYALTPRPSDGAMAWHQRPATLALAVLAMTALLNFVFF